MKEWNTDLQYKINEITTQINEMHTEILLKEVVEFCGQKDLFEYRISVDTLKEALDFYFKYKERAKGKWIFTRTNFDKCGFTVECPSCHKKWKTYDEMRWKKEYKFCPNCGTEMEEE